MGIDTQVFYNILSESWDVSALQNAEFLNFK